MALLVASYGSPSQDQSLNAVVAPENLVILQAEQSIPRAPKN
jgi:hypothetical protein